MYGRDSLSLEEVQSALYSKELKKKSVIKEEAAEGLTVRGRQEKRDFKPKNQSRSKSKPKNRKCFVCHKEGHFKKDYPDKKKKNSERKEHGDASEGYDQCRGFGDFRRR